MFFLTVGLGHSGTSWFTRAFNHPIAGIRCYHELKYLDYERCTHTRQPITDYTDRWDINREELRHPDTLASLHAPYWRHINRARRVYRVVGDVNSWRLPAVRYAVEHLRPDAVVLLIRNGIQVVDSIFATAKSLPEHHYFLSGYLQDSAHHLNAHEPPAPSDSFEAVCWHYATNLDFERLYPSLHNMPPLLIVKFDDLVGPKRDECWPNIYRNVTGARWWVPKPPVAVINLHRAPTTIQQTWDGWNEKQRTVFRRICGPTMERFGFRLL